MKLVIQHQSRPHPSEVVNGDLAVVESSEDVTLFGVIDVLGHGPEAAEVADIALSVLRRTHFERESLLDVMRRLDSSLEGTRGAAATLCRWAEGRLSVSGVGNVAARSHRMRLGMYAVPGILGRKVFPMRTDELRPTPGARLAIFSDGIHPAWDLAGYFRHDLEHACVDIMRRHSAHNDDATVLLAHFDENGHHP